MLLQQNCLEDFLLQRKYPSRVEEKEKLKVKTLKGRSIVPGHACVLCDTFAVVAWLNKLGIDVVMTNSAKTAYYAPTLNKVNVRLASLNQCVNTACG